MTVTMRTLALCATIAIIGFLVIKSFKKTKINRTLKAELDKYNGIINIDAETSKRNEDLYNITNKLSELEKNYKEKDSALNQNYLKRKEIYENLQKEVSLLEENLENISYGLYKPHYDYKTSEEFKQNLERIIDKQKQAIKKEDATYCPINWTVGNSKTEGKRMTKQYSKLMLRAFNGECDAAISRVKWNNIGNMEARIEKAYETINKLGSTHQITINYDYFELKLQELRLEFELQEKALQKVKLEIEKANGQELINLTEKIKTLEENLRKAQELKERATSRAQLTKSGHVYIISNIGSFGDSVYKVGMTRRLEPMDRVNELGDASVPFDFDVHGMIYSENAPELENILHKKLALKRLNLVNQKTEFFITTIDELSSMVGELNLNIQLTKIAEAKEYRETLSLKENQNRTSQKANIHVNENPKFPEVLI